ncbi:MAG: lysophospholipid acyltransferase family protein [Bacteroides sp.]|nr:lysophospholipid acyltransferase family protein [Bacteroides sp.]
MNTLLYYIYYTLCFLLSLLPFWLLYLLSDFIYFPLYYLIRYRRRVVRKNLLESFPHKTLKEIIIIEKEFYSFFCDYVFETVKLLSIGKENMRRRMKFQGLEELNQTFDQGRSVATYLGHYGNWEWVSSLPLSIRDGVVSSQIYHKLRNPNSDRLFLRLRGRMGAVSINMKESVRKILTMQREKVQFVMGFIADQSPTGQNINHWTYFLNHETAVLTGTEKLAKQLDLSVFYLDVKRVKRGYYTATFRKMMDHPKEYPDFEITDKYVALLEQSIKDAPQYWLWSHKRWKWTRAKFDEMFETCPDGRVRLRNHHQDYKEE